MHLGWHYYAVRAYDRAVEEVGKALAMEPFGLAHIQQGLNLEQHGRFDDGIAEFQKALTFSKGSTEILAYLGHAYAVAGRQTEAREVLRRLQELLQQKKYVSAFDVAIIHAGLGEPDQAFDWLEKAYAERSSGFSGLVYLNTDPRLDGLRSDPRFQDLLRRMKFPEDQTR